MAVQPHRAAAGQTAAALNLFGHFREQFRFRVRIRINENEPAARSSGRACVARAGDLVDWLEYHLRPGCARDFRSPVGRIVIADDELSRPALTLEHPHGLFQMVQGLGEKPLFVEGWDNDGDFQAVIIPWRTGPVLPLAEQREYLSQILRAGRFP